MKRNPFVVQSNITSYSYPASKIIICSVIISASLLRSYFLPSLAEWIDNLITFLCFFLTISSILCLYIGIIELCQAYENRIQKRNDSPKLSWCPLRMLLNLHQRMTLLISLYVPQTVQSKLVQAQKVKVQIMILETNDIISMIWNTTQYNGSRRH